MREDCLAHRAQFGPKSDRCVPRSGLQIKRQLVCTRAVRYKSNVIRKCRVLPFCSASVKSKFNIVVVNDDILNSYFHSPGSYRGTDNSNCLRKSPSTTCSSDSDEDCVFDAIPVSQDEPRSNLPVTVESALASAYHLSTIAIQISHSASRHENKVSHSVSRNENIDVCSAWSRHREFRVSVASHVPGHHSPPSNL